MNFTPPWGEQRLYNMIAERATGAFPVNGYGGSHSDFLLCRCGKISSPMRRSSMWPHCSPGRFFGLVCKQRKNWSRRADMSRLSGTTFTKETDIMDVWFDSGLQPCGRIEQREDLQWPADMYLEGSDQYRGWFNSSISTSVATTGKAPYTASVEPRFYLDGEGRKMSKSLGTSSLRKM